jgi:Trk-type K+ transport system membrane component
MYAALAVSIDVLHALTMIVWALGLPLLLWHRWPKMTVIYTWYGLAFVVLSQLSHLVFGECFFTTLSRASWEAAGDPAMGSFSARLVNRIAGFRPTEREVVIGWEVAIVLTSVNLLWSTYRRRRRERRAQPRARSA